MLKTCITVILLLLSLICFSQTEEYYYFDSNWKPVSQNSDYSYYRRIKYSENGNVYIPINDYYRNGEIQSSFYSDKMKVYGMKYEGTVEGMGMYNGKYVNYAENSISYYVNGKYSYSTKIDDTSSNNSNSSSNSSSASESSSGLLGLVAGAALLYGAYKAVSGSDNSSSSSSSSGSSSSSSSSSSSDRTITQYPNGPSYYYSKGGLTIKSFTETGTSVYGRGANYRIRNSNNYACIFTIKFLCDDDSNAGVWHTGNEHRIDAGEIYDFSDYESGMGLGKTVDIKIYSVE